MAIQRVSTIRALRVAAGLVLGTAASGVLAQERPGDGVYSDRIDWGVIMDLSGPTSASQGVWTSGLKDHVRKVNEAGGLHGRKINVLVEDDRFDPSLTRIAFEKLSTQTPVLGISGMGNASAQVALSSLVRRGKVPVVGSYTNTKAMIEPPTPMFYGGFCGYREMARVGAGFMTENLKLNAPKVVTVHLDTAGGKEYADYVAESVVQAGGTAKSVPIKANAADATPQVLEIINSKPDFIAVHGTATTPILLLRSMQQYGLNIPVFGMAYIGTPIVYSSLSAEAGKNYSFVSCFTPGSADEAPGVKDMAAHADKFGHAAMKDDINYVAGWSIGQLLTEAIDKLGPDVSRERLVGLLNKGFSIDTRGLSSQIGYTPDNHIGLVVLKPFSYDYGTKQFKAYGSYDQYQKFVK